MCNSDYVVSRTRAVSFDPVMRVRCSSPKCSLMFPIWKQMRKTQINQNQWAGEESTWEKWSVFIRGRPACRCTSGLGVLVSDPRLREAHWSFTQPSLFYNSKQDCLRKRERRPEVEPYYVGKLKSCIARTRSAASEHLLTASHMWWRASRVSCASGCAVGKFSTFSGGWERLTGARLLWYEGIVELLWRVAFFSLW